MRIAVFHHTQTSITNLTQPVRYVKKIAAQRLINDGVAEQIGKRAIRLKPIKCGHYKSGQSRTYETAAIDKHPRFFNGGLTRTEKSPKNIPAFQGARVGHG